jgi:hypothetical protein
MKQHRFAVTTLFIWSSLLIWMADFLFVYVFAALACARRFADVQGFGGLGIVPVAATTATLLAALATACLAWFAARRLRQESTADPHTQFIRSVTFGTSVLVLIALAWLALPPLIAQARC